MGWLDDVKAKGAGFKLACPESCLDFTAGGCIIAAGFSERVAVSTGTDCTCLHETSTT